MRAAGLDFGTSTTVLCTNDGQLKVQTIGDNEDVIPTVLAVTPTRRILIGADARKRALIDPENTIQSMKRVLGKQSFDPDVKRYAESYETSLTRSREGELQFETRIGPLTPLKAATLFLGHLQREMGIDTIASFAVALPERASAEQRAATAEAVAEAGFGQPRILTEPVAAALAFLYRQPDPGTYLVYDFGGGTFDAALVKWENDRPTVLTSAGDSYLGGDDIDESVAQWMRALILEEHRWDVENGCVSRSRLRYLSEYAKRQLTVCDETLLNLSSIDEVLRGKSVKLNRDTVARITNDVVSRTLTVCDRLFYSTTVTRHDLAGVLLVGGSTYSPWVRQRVADHYAGIPMYSNLPPDRVVAMGTALFAGQRK